MDFGKLLGLPFPEGTILASIASQSPLSLSLREHVVYAFGVESK